MSNRRFALLGAILSLGIILVVVINGCSDIEQAFAPTEPFHNATLDLNENVGETRLMKESIIAISIPMTGEMKEVYDPWIADVILSTLSDESRARLIVKGVAKVDDLDVAYSIVTIAGMENIDLSSGILLASWSCIKCGYADPPCCEPWPTCCDKDKDNGLVPFIVY